eukprot:TRINITY_DN56172_c0_g1_i1.p1 TRINITY_DN56172_c0_g1~~TRINITY_DN56172_c0_g1_i1.p1  ORF type:complete len:391 (+),score=69.89 TRINITY_DN56172_c0_g1_i1:72-1244(+)
MRSPANRGWSPVVGALLPAVCMLGVALVLVHQHQAHRRLARRRSRGSGGSPVTGPARLAVPDSPRAAAPESPWDAELARADRCRSTPGCTSPKVRWQRSPRYRRQDSDGDRGEDIFVLSDLFSADGMVLTGGVFGEVGALDGVWTSNTLDLETHFGWRGVLIEGCPQSAAEVVRNRPLATTVRKAVCAAGAGPTVEYEQRCGPLSGLNSVVPSHLQKWRTGKQQVPCSPMSEILRTANTTCIDFLSVDVEGFEYGLLSTIDFGAVNIRTLLLEIDSVERRWEIRDMLQANGYEHYAFVGPALNNQIWRQKGHDPRGQPCNMGQAAWRPVEFPPGIPLSPSNVTIPGHSCFGLPVLVLRPEMPLDRLHHRALGIHNNTHFIEYIKSFQGGH